MGKASSKADLSASELDELVSSTGLTSADVSDWYDKFRHEFPSGHMDRRQFRAVYTRLFPRCMGGGGGDAERFCDQVKSNQIK